MGQVASGYTQEQRAISDIGLTSFVKIQHRRRKSTNKLPLNWRKRPLSHQTTKQVFDKWVHMIGREIGGISEEEYALLFC